MNIKWNKTRSICYFFSKIKDELNILRDSQENNIFIKRINQTPSWEDFINSFMNEFSLKDFYSYKTVQKKVLEIYSDEVDLSDFINNLLILGKELNSSMDNEQTFVFKTNNIQTDKSYCFGNVTICDGNAEYNNQSIRGEMIDFLNNLKSSDYLKNQKDIFIDFINETTADTVILVKAKGDDILAKAKAIDEARDFLDEITFFANILGWIKVLPSLEIDKPNTSNFIKINKKLPLISYAQLEDESVFPVLFTLNNDSNVENNRNYIFASYLIKYGFPIYQKAENSSLLARVTVAISWCAKAYRTLDRHNKFLFCCIGLEALFSTTSDLENVSETLANRCSSLLANTIKDHEKLKKIVKSLYCDRSGIAHGRKPSILEKDLSTVLRVLIESIVLSLKLSKNENIIQEEEYFQLLDNKIFDE